MCYQFYIGAQPACFLPYLSTPQAPITPDNNPLSAPTITLSRHIPQQLEHCLLQILHRLPNIPRCWSLWTSKHFSQPKKSWLWFSNMYRKIFLQSWGHLMRQQLSKELLVGWKKCLLCTSHVTGRTVQTRWGAGWELHLHLESCIYPESWERTSLVDPLLILVPARRPWVTRPSRTRRSA